MLNTPLNRRLRMALIGGGGTGFIGKVHRTAATLDGRAELVSGAFSSDAGRSRDAALTFSVAPDRAFDSIDRLIDDELRRPADQRADFITIATPNWLHFPMARAALLAGFHVVCEKPMTVTLDQADELVQLVEQTGQVFAVTHNYSGYPLIRHAQAMIAAGELGEIRAVRVNYVQGWMRGLTPGATPPRGAWKDDPAKNGAAGTMGDIGTHAWQLARYVSGLIPVELSATLRTYAPGRQLDDYGHVLVRCTSETLILVTASQVTHGRLNDLTLEVDGDKASLAWRQEDPNVLIVRQTGRPQQIFDRHPAADWTSAAGRNACRLPAGHPEAFFEAFANVYTAAFDDMLSRVSGQPRSAGQPIYPDVYDGREGVRFITQVLASHQGRGAWTPLAPG